MVLSNNFWKKSLQTAFYDVGKSSAGHYFFTHGGQNDGNTSKKDPKTDAAGSQKAIQGHQLPLPRDEAIRGIRKLGRSEWKRQVGYHRRSVAETAMFRIKKMFGAELKNRTEKTQKTEARVRYKILNHCTKLGMQKINYE